MYMNALEWCALFVCASALWLLFSRCLKSKAKAVFALAFTLPALFFCLNGATQAITVDEYQYIFAFSNTQNSAELLSRGLPLSKGLYQYRTTQMTLGVLFDFLRGFGFAFHNQTRFLTNTSLLLQGYKLAHWLLCAAMLFCILYVLWRWYFPDALKQKNTAPLFLGGMGAVLFALPTNTLMCKVANYDATSAFPSVLGVLLAGAFLLRRSRKAAAAGILCAFAGSMEKISSVPWFYATLLLILLGILRHNPPQNLCKRILKTALILCGVLLGCIALSALNLANILSYAHPDKLRELGIALNTSMVLFPLIFLYQFLTEGKFRMDIFIAPNPWLALLVMALGIFAAALLIYGVTRLVEKRAVIYRLMPQITARALAVILPVFLLLSAIGAYFVPVMTLGFIAPDAGDYQPESEVTQNVYHYGAKTKAGHAALSVLNHFGVNIASLPTVFTIFLCVLCFMLWRAKKPGREIFMPALFVLSAILCPAVFALGGQPQGERYYAIPINLFIIGAVLLLCHTAGCAGLRLPHLSPKVSSSIVKSVCALSVTLALFFAELSLYAPNIKVFSPVWLVRSAQLNAYPQQGVWHAGEAMCWGDDYMYASKAISAWYAENGRPGTEFGLYSDYGGQTFGDRYSRYLSKDDLTEESFAQDTWFSFSRFRLYRQPLPDFIYQVQPFFTVKFNGMTAVWVYRADQLTEYKAYLLP